MLGLSRHTAAFRTMTSVMAVATMAVTAPAFAQQVRNFDIPAQAASKGVPQFAKQAGIQILANGNTLRGKRTNAVRGAMPVDSALRTLLSGTGLVMRDGVDGSGIKTIVEAPRQFSAAPAPVAMTQAVQEARAPVYDEIIVTAQKKEERITDVPIAMSAFSAESLDEYKIEGGSELLRAVPNVSFSKSNFASYNFSIRGIGTKALSVASDPGVAISFNNTPLIRNRLFEQEYFDVERVEVLRGPQGTLYGRNATGGVVNMITSKPKLDEFDGNLKAEIGNYNSRRIAGMVNVPVADTLAVRVAGALTKRDGFDYNTYTKEKVNGRDLWSSRASLTWEPTSSLTITGIWEHFEEDDNRSRTGKQLCHRDEGPEAVGTKDTRSMVVTRGALSQGCKPGPIYAPEAFGVPNGLSMPQVIAGGTFVIGNDPGTGARIYLLDRLVDPYSNIVQSRNLREINTQLDPVFKAKNDVYQLNFDYQLNDRIKLYSQSSYSKDQYYSTQDYYRFVSNDAFGNSYGLNDIFGPAPWVEGFTPYGVLSDYQLGASKKLLGMDMVKSKSDQYYQEFRVQSEFEEGINFNFGANYLKFDIDEDYYVFNNMFTILAEGVFGAAVAGTEPVDCSTVANYQSCVYVDRNSIEKLGGDGHNYFRSRNKGSTESYGLFGELYVPVSSEVKLTAGLRYTRDKKSSTPYKTQLLLAPGPLTAGRIGRGLEAGPDIIQRWGAVTGRLVVDWKPVTNFADDLLVYGSYSRGYKGGGANPPSIDFNPDQLVVYQNPETFEDERVHALEVGLKGAMWGRKLTFSAAAFYYNYEDYQVSQIVDRLALNENFDAEMWGADLELAYRPTSKLRFNANFGYLKTKIGKGEESIDVMNRTQGNADYVVVKPFMQLPSNCIVPTATVQKIISHVTYSDANGGAILNKLCAGIGNVSFKPGTPLANRFQVSFDPMVDSPNSGRGFMAPLHGNELPNAPRWTVSLGGQYVVPIGEWEAAFRADYYHQAKSWSRVYNAENDRLKSWDNLNLSLSVDRPDDGLSFQIYVKNVLNKDSITDSFINSDDSALTTNVFTVDPRIVGFKIVKDF